MDSFHASASGKKQESNARRNCFRVWTLIGAIILSVVLAYLLKVLSIPVGIIIWSAIFVFLLRSPVNWLERKGLNRTIGTALSYVVAFLVLGLFFFISFSPAFGLGGQFTNLVENVPGYIEQISQWYAQFASQYEGFLQNDVVKSWIDEAAKSLAAWGSGLVLYSADGIMAIGSAIVNSLMVIGFALVVAFWILMDLPAIKKEYHRLIPKRFEESSQAFYLTLTRVMGGYLKATLLQCLLIGLGCSLAFALIGIPNAAALGVIAGLLNIIPVVGPWFGGALAAIVGVFVSPFAALVAFVATIAIQQVIYTFVSPKLMSDSVNIHPALVFIALFSGSAIGGVMGGLMGTLVGMLASIPAVAVLSSLFVYAYERKTGLKISSPDGVFFKDSFDLHQRKSSSLVDEEELKERDVDTIVETSKVCDHRTANSTELKERPTNKIEDASEDEHKDTVEDVIGSKAEDVTEGGSTYT